MLNVAFVGFALGLLIAVMCVVLRLRHKITEGAERDSMILLIASTRDAMLITALYLADSLSYLANDVFSFASQQYPNLIVAAPLIVMALRFFLFAFAGWIALRRIYILGVWLKAQT